MTSAVWSALAIVASAIFAGISAWQARRANQIFLESRRSDRLRKAEQLQMSWMLLCSDPVGRPDDPESGSWRSESTWRGRYSHFEAALSRLERVSSKADFLDVCEKIRRQLYDPQNAALEQIRTSCFRIQDSGALDDLAIELIKQSPSLA